MPGEGWEEKGLHGQRAKWATMSLPISHPPWNLKFSGNTHICESFQWPPCTGALSPRDREDKCEVYTHQPHANMSLAESLAVCKKL